MSNECNNDCGNCSVSDCADRKKSKSDFLEKPHELSKIKKVIGVVSGKGGVGKSIVTSMLSVISNRRDYKTAIIDADITGPSIPKAFGLKEKATGTEGSIFPVNSKKGIEIMSLNLLLEDETAPVVWRGPILANTVKQFWSDVVWNEVDYMFVDMPPGTGDVPLTVFQSLPVDGIIIVTSPQELVSMIVEKAVNMAKMMNIPILGIVENMSFFKCPNCNEKHYIYGESHIDEVAKKAGVEAVAKMPINPSLASNCDRGLIELFEGDYLEEMFDAIEKQTGMNK